MNILEVRNKIKFEHKTIFELPIKVTFYARVSTTTEAQQNSISNQIAYFQSKIKDNPNWTYIEGYVDEIRGEKASNRESFQRMVADAKAQKFDLILTKEISRFARDTIDSLSYTRQLLIDGVCVNFENDNLNTIDEDSELRLTIMSSIAQEEVRKLSGRVKFGHKRSIEKGVVLGNARIFGYDKVDGKLIINEKQAEMVRKVFSLYLQDNSLKQIEKILYEDGYRNNNGKAISHSTLANMIRNPKYKGFYCGNKVKIIDYRTKKQEFLPKEEWVMYKDETGETVPSIVSEEVWDEANLIIEKRYKSIIEKKSSIKLNNIYTNKLVCGIDGAYYYKNSYSRQQDPNREKNYWKCSQKTKNGTESCKSFSLYEKDLNNMIRSLFKMMSEDNLSYIDEYIEMFKTVIQKNGGVKEANTIQDNINKILKKKEKLLELSLENLISNIEFSSRNNDYNTQITQLQKRLNIIKSQTNDVNDRVSNLIKLKHVLKNEIDFSSDTFLSTDKDIRTIVTRFIDKIIITPTDTPYHANVDIVLFCGNRFSAVYESGSKNTQILNRSSGQIIKKMCTELQLSFNKKKRNYINHEYVAVFNIGLAIT